MRKALKALWSAVVFTVLVGLIMMGLVFVIFIMAGDPLIEPAQVAIGDRDVRPYAVVSFGFGLLGGVLLMLAANAWGRRH